MSTRIRIGMSRLTDSAPVAVAPEQMVAAPPHALWFPRQMRRWGWLDDGGDLLAVASAVYRPDLYAVAARTEDLFVISGSSRNNAKF